jgi:hypothetical protein
MQSFPVGIIPRADSSRPEDSRRNGAGSSPPDGAIAILTLTGPDVEVYGPVRSIWPPTHP